MVTHTDTVPAAQRPTSPEGREFGAAIRGIPEFFVVRSGLDQGHAGFTVGLGAVTLAAWSPPSI
jgi:inactivated superfamily I helicase